MQQRLAFTSFQIRMKKKNLSFNTHGVVTTDYLRANTSDLKTLLLNGVQGVKCAMAVITARARCLKKVGILTPLHTT